MKNVCRLAESVSGFGTNGLEDHGQWAEFGKRGLEQIDAYKGGQPQPVHRMQLRQGQTGQVVLFGNKPAIAAGGAVL